jgi:hypothetical protein
MKVKTHILIMILHASLDQKLIHNIMLVVRTVHKSLRILKF